MKGMRRWAGSRKGTTAILVALLTMALAGVMAAVALAGGGAEGTEASRPALADLVLAAGQDVVGYEDDVSADDSTDGDFSADDSTDFLLYGDDLTNEPDEPDAADVSSDDLSDGDFSNENTDYAPDVTKAVASVRTLWPANGKMHKIKILGITDKDGNAVSVKITKITSDEPTNSGKKAQWPDAEGVGTSAASVRAERSSDGDGRVYVIKFTATDESGCWRSGTVLVGVPSTGSNVTPLDSGQWYDATTKN